MSFAHFLCSLVRQGKSTPFDKGIHLGINPVENGTILNPLLWKHREKDPCFHRNSPGGRNGSGQIDYFRVIITCDNQQYTTTDLEPRTIRFSKCILLLYEFIGA